MSNKVIVITGGTRGIGQNFCNYFLSNNCHVVYTGTSESSVLKANEYYKKTYDESSFLGVVADVRNYDDCNKLVQTALNKFNQVDIFISNAGVDITHKAFHELPIDEINKAIDINLKGSLNCSHAILKHYNEVNKGALYLMEGFGSDERVQPGYTSYGTSKYAIRYLSKSLANDYKNTNIIIGNLSPGMVATTLLTKSLYELPIEKRQRTIKMYNILADKPETVVAFLAQGILENTKNNAKIHWLTGSKIALRFLTAKFIKRDIINKDDFL